MAEPGFTLIDDGQAVEVAYGDGVERAGHAQRAGRPVALDLDERAAYLGVLASARAAALASLEAPDFTLPGLDGRPHTPSAHRGTKVLLGAYASRGGRRLDLPVGQAIQEGLRAFGFTVVTAALDRTPTD